VYTVTLSDSALQFAFLQNIPPA